MNLKEIIFNAASKAAYDALVKEIKNALTLKRATQIKVSGAVDHGNGFSRLGFGGINFNFVYYGINCVISLSPSGQIFYVTATSAHETIMNCETCVNVESMFKKLDKKLKSSK